MRVAHLIMAYKNPAQLERLIKRLHHPQFDVYIHLDKKIDIRSFEHLGNLDRVFFIRERVLCNWGGFSFVNAITNSVREILKERKHEYINLMSAQDYPLKPNSYIYDFLERNKGQSFVSFEESDSDWWKHAITRYELYHFTDIKIKGRYLVQSILNNITPKRKFPIPLKMYGCAKSSWWTLTSECAEYVVKFLDNNARLLKFMRFTWAADEFLYPTILMNSRFKESINNNNYRHIEWEEGKSNPRIFGLADFKTLECSSHFFARKFDTTVDTKIMDALDEHVDSDKYIKI